MKVILLSALVKYNRNIQLLGGNVVIPNEPMSRSGQPHFSGGLLQVGGRRDTRCPRPPAGCPEVCATMNKVCKGACKGRPRGRAHEVARRIQKLPASFALGLSCIPWGQRHGRVGVAGTQAPARAQVPMGHRSFGAQSQRHWASAFSHPPPALLRVLRTAEGLDHNLTSMAALENT